jgi:hypothetical protein
MRLLVLLLIAIAAVRAAPGAAPPIHYADGRVTGELRDADAGEVLREIARQAALEVRGSLAEPRIVTVELVDVPLEQALTRVLGAQSFVLSYRKDRLHGIRLIGGANPDAIMASPPPMDLPAPPNDYDGEPALVASHAPIAIGGRLARAVGSDRTSFAVVMGVAMRHDDPRVRADALRIGLRALEASPALQTTFLATLDQMTDERLTEWVVRVAGPYASDVARTAARSSRLDSIKLRAAAIERHLAAAPPRH